MLTLIHATANDGATGSGTVVSSQAGLNAADVPNGNLADTQQIASGPVEVEIFDVEIDSQVTKKSPSADTKYFFVDAHQRLITNSEGKEVRKCVVNCKICVYVQCSLWCC